MELLSSLIHKVKLSCLVFSFIILPSPLFSAKELPLIAISQYISHDAVDLTYQGLITGLAKHGFIADHNIKIIHKNAAGNVSTNAVIATYIKSLKPAVAVGLTTPSAQALFGIRGPLVFSMVSDPLDAKLVSCLRRPGGNVTGVTDMPPVEEQIKLIKQLLPQAKLIAVPYNPGESNSVKQVELIQTMALKHGLKVQLLPFSSSSQIQTALAKAIDSGADAYLTPLDNIVASSITTLVHFANKHKIPVFASDNLHVINNQSLATVGFNYYDIGFKTGEVVAQILKGQKPGDIAVSTSAKKDYYFNLKAAKLLGIQIPENLLKQAKQIIK